MFSFCKTYVQFIFYVHDLDVTFALHGNMKYYKINMKFAFIASHWQVWYSSKKVKEEGQCIRFLWWRMNC